MLELSILIISLSMHFFVFFASQMLFVREAVIRVKLIKREMCLCLISCGLILNGPLFCLDGSIYSPFFLCS